MLDERLRLRLELDSFYADYTATLDEGRWQDWPEFFLDDCLYRLMPRENYTQGLDLCIILCESKGMLLDRVAAITDTSTYGPRALRNYISGLRVRSRSEGAVETESSFLQVETMNDEPSRVFLSGRAYDRLVPTEGGWKLSERLCVFDSNLVLNSLIVPV